jgi:quercetin dioxygenase-like cupin family protein
MVSHLGGARAIRVGALYMLRMRAKIFRDLRLANGGHMKLDVHKLSLGIGLSCLIIASALTYFDVAAQDATASLRQQRVGGSVPVETDFIAGARRFEAGNRTYWHSHAGGFILFVQEGRARVQTRGEPMQELGPGAVYYTPPGVEHWHGAAPGEGLLQLGVIPFGGGIEFLEAVTDAQYNGESL